MAALTMSSYKVETHEKVETFNSDPLLTITVIRARQKVNYVYITLKEKKYIIVVMHCTCLQDSYFQMVHSNRA